MNTPTNEAMPTLVRDTINQANTLQPHSPRSNLFIISSTDKSNPDAVLYLQHGDQLWCSIDHPYGIELQANDDGYPTRDSSQTAGGIPIRGLYINRRDKSPGEHFAYLESINPISL